MEQSNTSMNVSLQDNNDSSNKLKITNLKGTPFSVIEENEEYFAVIGSHRITETYETFEKCEKETKKITWDRIVQVIWAISLKVEDINKLNKL